MSLFTPGVLPDAETVGNFQSDPQQVERAVNLLADAGFEVLQANELMINIAGPRELYESAFGTTLVAEERPTLKGGQVEDTATFIDTTDTDVSGLCSTGGTRFEDVLEGVAIEEPAYLCAVNAFPPAVDYFKLDVPADVSLGLQRRQGAPRRHHRQGHHRRDGRHRLADAPVLHRRAGIASTRRCSVPAPPTRASTRTATAPASRRTSSPRRPT